MLRVRDLRVEKDGHTICRVPELDVSRGERVAVIGPNGSGKSTLLRVLADLEREIIGECRVDPPRQERVYVHQTPYLFRGSVLFNVGYGLAARRVARKEWVSAARHWLNVFGVSQLAERHCKRLSGGERRRVALARAFAIQPALMLLDEPLADLDESGIDIVCGAVNSQSASTIVIASPVPLPANLVARSCGIALASS